MRSLAVVVVVVSALSTAALALVVVAGLNRFYPSSTWSENEREALRSLWLGSLPPLPADPSNRYGNDERAARLGARIFRDPRFSANGRVACASCHQPKQGFSDGSKLARGLQQGTRNTPSIVASAWGHFYFWDGRRDSQWAQALVPLEGAAEHGGTRTQFLRLLSAHYRREYEEIFGALPQPDTARFPERASPLGSDAARAAWNAMALADRDAVNRAFANIGKSLAAYERQLSFRPSRFDEYAEQVLKGNAWFASLKFSSQETLGLRLFVGKANCTLCHRGPMLTSFEFFSLGLPLDQARPDYGRSRAFAEVERDPFNCLGRYSDARPEACVELRFMAHDALGFLANFKTPSLRDVAATAPYMQSGQFATLEQVVEHYNRASPVPFPEHSDIRPLGLSPAERAAIVAFLKTLTSPIADPLGKALD